MEFNPVEQSLAFVVENRWAILIESIKVQVNLGNFDSPRIDVQPVYLQAIRVTNQMQIIIKKNKTMLTQWVSYLENGNDFHFLNWPMLRSMKGYCKEVLMLGKEN